jgi:hypothetical protein
MSLLFIEIDSGPAKKTWLENVVGNSAALQPTLESGLNGRIVQLFHSIIRR